MASKQATETRLSTLLPAEKASAEAVLDQAQVEYDKTFVRAGVDGRVEQFALRPGDVVTLTTDITRTFEIVAPLKSRVGAKVISKYATDRTPPSEYEKPRDKAMAAAGVRRKGSGRPTKRDRRILSSFFGAEN